MKSDFFDGRYRKMFQPWNLSGGPRQNEPEAYGAYEQGHVDGTLHEDIQLCLEVVVETPLEGSVAKELTIQCSDNNSCMIFIYCGSPIRTLYCKK